MITNVIPPPVSVVSKPTNDKKATTKTINDNCTRLSSVAIANDEVLTSPKTLTTEKVTVMAFPEMINAGIAGSSGVNKGGNSQSSDDSSFESLFNGSTYYIDEYFNSIGYNGGLSICNSTNNECRSTISGLTGGYDSYFDDNNDNTCNTSNDIESLYTASSSSSSSTLNGLNIIPNDAVSLSSSSSSSSSSSTTASHSSRFVDAMAAANLEAMPPASDKKMPGAISSLSFRVKLLLLLEKMLVILLLLVITTGCVVTTIAIIRYLRLSGNDNSSSIVAAPGIMTSSSNQTTNTADSINGTSSDDERFFRIRVWLSQHYGDTNFNPMPGTPQHDALTWMAYVDVPSLLGSDLQLRIPSTTNDTNEKEAAVRWNANLSIRITQRFALLLFFFNNIGTENLMLGGWASLTGARLTECIWPGITCRTIAGATSDSKISVVTGLELNPWIAHLHGTLPTEIGLLTYLETLVLTDNLLTGDLPSELFVLQKLHTLRISKTLVSTLLSPDIGNLTEMTFLDISNNFIRATIPTEVGLLTNLRYLNLAQNTFSGTIPSELGQLQLLENFFLEDNSFHGVMPPAICLLPLSHRLEELHADCESPFYERIFCEPTKTRILCDCCTYCF